MLFVCNSSLHALLIGYILWGLDHKLNALYPYITYQNWTKVAYMRLSAVRYIVCHSGADKRPLPSNAPPKQAAMPQQKRSLQAL